MDVPVKPMTRPLIKAIHVPSIKEVRGASVDSLNSIELTLELYQDGVEWTATVVLTHIRCIEQWSHGGYVFVGTYCDLSTLTTEDSTLFIEDRTLCRVSCHSPEPPRVQFVTTLEANSL